MQFVLRAFLLALNRIVHFWGRTKCWVTPAEEKRPSGPPPAAARFREKAIPASWCQCLVLSRHELPDNEVAALSFGLQFHGGVLALIRVTVFITCTQRYVSFGALTTAVTVVRAPFSPPSAPLPHPSWSRCSLLLRSLPTWTCLLPELRHLLPCHLLLLLHLWMEMHVLVRERQFLNKAKAGFSSDRRTDEKDI